MLWSCDYRSARNTPNAATSKLYGDCCAKLPPPPPVPHCDFRDSRGWIVVVSDYEGPQSRLFDGVTSGRGVLDGIRATPRSSIPTALRAPPSPRPTRCSRRTSEPPRAEPTAA
ncbi:lipase family protein [Nocardia sp. NPDC049190]|uniref:lipase family protein n=1 Tax=Nocardia sp. NPDC049190 TaxID=3155650 RepID=UPI0033DA9204